jgi:hypothetical protein
MDIERSTFAQLIQDDRASRESKVWRGTFLDYLEKVKENPTITKLAHSRFYDMIVPQERPTNGSGTKFSTERSTNNNGDQSAALLVGLDSDHTLVKECCAGNREAFNGLVLRHKDRLYTLAVRLLGDRGDAEDITQDTFLRS